MSSLWYGRPAGCSSYQFWDLLRRMEKLSLWLHLFRTNNYPTKLLPVARWSLHEQEAGSLALSLLLQLSMTNNTIASYSLYMAAVPSDTTATIIVGSSVFFFVALTLAWLAGSCRCVDETDGTITADAAVVFFLWNGKCTGQGTHGMWQGKGRSSSLFYFSFLMLRDTSCWVQFA